MRYLIFSFVFVLSSSLGFSQEADYNCSFSDDNYYEFQSERFTLNEIDKKEVSWSGYLSDDEDRDLVSSSRTIETKTALVKSGDLKGLVVLELKISDHARRFSQSFVLDPKSNFFQVTETDGGSLTLTCKDGRLLR